MAGANVDVTERKRAEAALREVNATLKAQAALLQSQEELFPDIPQRWKEMHRHGLEGETLRVDEDRWVRKDALLHGFGGKFVLGGPLTGL